MGQETEATVLAQEKVRTDVLTWKEDRTGGLKVEGLLLQDWWGHRKDAVRNGEPRRVLSGE